MGVRSLDRVARCIHCGRSRFLCGLSSLQRHRVDPPLTWSPVHILLTSLISSSATSTPASASRQRPLPSVPTLLLETSSTTSTSVQRLTVHPVPAAHPGLRTPNGGVRSTPSLARLGKCVPLPVQSVARQAPAGRPNLPTIAVQVHFHSKLCITSLSSHRPPALSAEMHLKAKYLERRGKKE